MSNDTLINALKQAREALTETYYFAWDGMANVVWIDKRHDTIKAIDDALAANTATAPSQPAPLANVGIRDNTATMSREMWEAGRVLWSVTAEELEQNENLRDRPPFGTYPDVHRPAPTVPRLKDNEIALLVNDLRTIAQQYHRHGCLRDLISRAIVPPLKEGRREDMKSYMMPPHVARAKRIAELKQEIEQLLKGDDEPIGVLMKLAGDDRMKLYGGASGEPLPSAKKEPT